MIAEIIAMPAPEMLTPFRRDTNSLYLADGLNDLGVQVAFKTIVGDSLAHLTSAAIIAISLVDIVIFSGGLGPTEDDLALAKLPPPHSVSTFTLNNAVLAALYKRFAARQMVMPSSNAKRGRRPRRRWRSSTTKTAVPRPHSSTSTILDSERQTHSQDRHPPSRPAQGTQTTLHDDEAKPRLAASLPVRHLARRIALRMALIPESHVGARTAPIYPAVP